MIGCMAKATSDALNVDFEEMDEVRWVTREQAALAVLASQDRKDPYPSTLKTPYLYTFSLPCYGR